MQKKRAAFLSKPNGNAKELTSPYLRKSMSYTKYYQKFHIYMKLSFVAIRLTVIKLRKILDFSKLLCINKREVTRSKKISLS